MIEGSAEITKGLESILDTHGYGFQYAVLATAQRLFSPTTIHGSRWRLPIAEFPVEVNGCTFPRRRDSRTLLTAHGDGRRMQACKPGS